MKNTRTIKSKALFTYYTQEVTRLRTSSNPYPGKITHLGPIVAHQVLLRIDDVAQCGVRGALLLERRRREERQIAKEREERGW